MPITRQPLPWRSHDCRHDGAKIPWPIGIRGREETFVVLAGMRIGRNGG